MSRIPDNANVPRSVYETATAALDAANTEIATLEAQGWQTLSDVNMVTEASVDVKALGNGDQTVGGLPVTLVTVANVTSLDITNGVGLVWVGGNGPTAMRIRLAAMTGVLDDSKPREYRVTVFQSVSGMAGAEDAWVYFMQGSGTVVSGFALTASNYFTLGGVDLGVIGSTAVIRVSDLYSGALLESGAAVVSLTRRGITGSSAGATGIVWTGEIPTFSMELNTGPFTWTITRIIVEYRGIDE